MRERRWLCRLGVRDAGHQRLDVFPDQVRQRGPEIEHLLSRGEQSLTKHHPVHRRPEVIAGAGELEIAAGIRPRDLDQASLDGEEEILHRGRVFERIDATLFDLPQGVQESRRVLARDDAGLGQHERMRLVGGDHMAEEVPLAVVELWLQDVPRIRRMRE